MWTLTPIRAGGHRPGQDRAHRRQNQANAEPHRVSASFVRSPRCSRDDGRKRRSAGCPTRPCAAAVGVPRVRACEHRHIRRSRRRSRGARDRLARSIRRASAAWAASCASRSAIPFRHASVRQRRSAAPSVRLRAERDREFSDRELGSSLSRAPPRGTELLDSITVREQQNRDRGAVPFPRSSVGDREREIPGDVRVHPEQQFAETPSRRASSVENATRQARPVAVAPPGCSTRA